jgi:glycine hydroxymethyltransferase
MFIGILSLSRYYGGNEQIDKAERLCQNRALKLFGLNPEEWGVNVQTLSGSPANFQVYNAVLEAHDKILGLNLPDGGHLSHGYQTETKKISAVSKYFTTFPYFLDQSTGIIDYDKLEVQAESVRPNLIVAGASAYSRNYDYPRMRKIADKYKSYLLSDMAHISGLVAAGVVPSPFPYSDIVTTTTHKSLRGPRGAMIFYRKGVRNVDAKGNKIMWDLEEKINFSVFPGLQGGPHNHTISALSTALLQASMKDFKDYQNQVKLNAAHMAKELMSRGYDIVSGGTDNHLILVNLKNKGIDGARAERVLELASISTNKNTVPGDKSALTPGGIRLGTPALTTRGFVEEDISKVVEFLDRAFVITKNIKENLPVGKNKLLKDFKEAAKGDLPEIQKLRSEVEDFACGFPTIGYSEKDMRYK